MTTVTVIRKSGPDKYGDRGSELSRSTISGCEIAPGRGVAGSRASSEMLDRGREGVDMGVILFAPFAADILHTDQIITPDGVLWDVDGDIARWEYKGSRAGSVVPLTRANG